MMRLKTGGLLAALAIAGLCATAQAQQAPPPLLSVVRVQVKPDRVHDWRELTKKNMEAHKKGGGGFRHVWRSRTGNPYEYAIVREMENYAQLDSPNAVRRGMSEADFARMQEVRRNYVESVEITYREPIPELSIPWTSVQPPAMITTSTSTVRPGMASSYIEIKKEQAAALKKAGITGYGVHRLMWGGSRKFVTWWAHDKMAELDGPNPMQRIMDEDARTKWLKAISPTLQSTEWNIWAYESELSYQPAE